MTQFVALLDVEEEVGVNRVADHADYDEDYGLLKVGDGWQGNVLELDGFGPV